MDNEAIVFYTVCVTYVGFWLCLELHHWLGRWE